MACKVLLFFPRRFLSLSITQVPLGVLSAGDAEALSPIEGSTLSKRTTQQFGRDLRARPEGGS